MSTAALAGANAPVEAVKSASALVESEPTGGVRLTVRTPKGVPATVTLTRGGTKATVAKKLASKKTTTRLRLRDGRWRVSAPSVQWRGRLYVAAAAPKRVSVTKGRTTTVSVRYRRLESASALRVTDVSQSSVELAWKAKADTQLRVVAKPGTDPARNTKDGRPVTIGREASKATVGGLRPGQPMSFNLFVKSGKRWVGPTTILGTAASTQLGVATYLAADATRILTPQDIALVESTPGALLVTLTNESPVVGSTLVLPASAQLPGGFVGRVDSVDLDGTARLSMTSVDSAFDLFHVRFDTTQGGARFVAPGTPSSLRAGRARASTSDASTSGKAKASCTTEEGGTPATQITVDVTATATPHAKFNLLINKLEIKYFPDAPIGGGIAGYVGIDSNVVLDLGLAASVSCTVKTDLPALTLPAGPLNFAVKPTVSGSVGLKGAIKVTGLKLVDFEHYWPVTAVINAAVPNAVQPPAPTSHEASPPTFEGSVALTGGVGLDIEFGPGVGVPSEVAEAKAGITAGVTLGTSVKAGVSRPLTADAPWERCISFGGVTLAPSNPTGWFGIWALGKQLGKVEVVIPIAQGEFQLVPPKTWPADCSVEEPPPPTTPSPTLPPTPVPTTPVPTTPSPTTPTPTTPTTSTTLPILRTEVYEGALDGDDPDLPNAMGSQPGNNYLPGPAALADDDPSTRIRISSGWAADWVAVLDGTPAASATSIKVTAVVTPVYLDPADVDHQYAEIKLSLIDYLDDGRLSNYLHAEATARFRVEAGQTRTIEWIIDETWLNGTHNGDSDHLDFDNGLHWYDTDPYISGGNGPHEFAAFRDRLLAGSGSTVGLYMTKYAGAHPYEVDVSKVKIEAVRPG